MLYFFFVICHPKSPTKPWHILFCCLLNQPRRFDIKACCILVTIPIHSITILTLYHQFPTAAISQPLRP
ncbi:hypothetical protein Lalb_Chr02g0148891 [Lupinus albus]|uniref:Uncharacterized protein n=1 Tax=Lupinus albus TaxID=3870 RepID=A0A6A4QYY7_LUPAL|nr:hypothetical protein Lalb_Chr02g0148891 [Lupinus albus]